MEEKKYQLWQHHMSKRRAVTWLRNTALEGLKDRVGGVDQERMERLKEELAWLRQSEGDFLQQLLILWDASDYARCIDNPTSPGTGTLPGSILAYGLGITGLDPIRAGLRSPFQGTPPRLALEMAPDMIEEVMDYLRETYGAMADSIELTPNFRLGRFRQVLTGDSPADEVWHLPETETEGARHILENMPLDDPAVFELLSQGKEVCLFERPQAWTLLRDLQPRSMEELTAAVAFCEMPGGGMGDPRYALYRRDRRGEGPYGWLLYREQVEDLLRDCREQGEGAALRRLGPDLAEVLQAWNLPHAWGGEIVQLSMPLFLLGHSVSKGHAAARALLTYQDAYLRVHYPREYEKAACWYLPPEDDGPEA